MVNKKKNTLLYLNKFFFTNQNHSELLNNNIKFLEKIIDPKILKK